MGRAGNWIMGKVSLVPLKTAKDLIHLTDYYATHTADGLTVHPISKHSEFRNEDGTGAIETAYQYQWHPDTVQMLQRTTVLPIVPADQNGSGTADTRAP